MQFSLPTQEFAYVVQKCLNVVSQKPAIPILGNLLIEASRGRVTVTATDLTVSVRSSIDADVVKEGAITLPARRLAQLLREISSMSMTMTVHQEIAEIQAGASLFRLHGMKKNDFPAFPDTTQGAQFLMEQAALKDALFRTAFAVSREDNRYVLTGVLMEVEGEEATFLGTDGKRLARSKMVLGTPLQKGSYIIPIKAVEEMLKHLGDEGEINLFLMGDKIGMKTEDTVLFTKLLSGEYPDISRVIPEKPDKLVSLHREEMTSLLRQVSLFTSENNQSVRFSFSPGELKLTINTQEIGEGKVSMPVNYQGESMDIAFNPNYFLDILKHTRGETVLLGVTDSYNPGLIMEEKENSLPPKEATPLYVLMPMRLGAH